MQSQNMRRKDRQITHPDQIQGILERCQVCRLGILDGEEPYVVPLSYGFIRNKDQFTLYFHCAKEGKKLDLLKKNSRVCAEISRSLGVVGKNTPCSYTTGYESVIGWGNIQVLTQKEEKAQGLSALMRHYTGQDFTQFEPEVLSRTTVLALPLQRLTGKAHLVNED